MEAVLLERWQTYWNWLFYGLLAVSTGVAAADAGSAGRRVAIVVLAAGLAVSYWRAVAREGRFGLGTGSALPSLVAAAALWVPLLLLHWLFQLLMFSAYYLACSAPVPLRRAISAIAVVSAIVVATESVREGGLDSLQVVFYGAVTLALGLFLAMMHAISEQSEERKRLIADLEATREELAESERRAGALGERQRLAREIHDTLAQGFASIVTLCEAARAEFSSRPDVVMQRLEEAGRTARESLAEARRVVWALRPEALEERTLADALAELAAAFCSETGVDAESIVSGEARDLGPEIDATLLRVAQEALANARKHARATRVTLTLTYLDDAVLLDVRDDGVGFELESGATRRNGWHRGGFGLTGMRERLEQLGGTLTIESAAGAGATIVATLPASLGEPAR
ncbi:MAG TPA: sensor histidine kinase [Gaiellaceae bacterium]|nr:sensor histidine kinase [Gaiellaceae bacterium]